LKQFCNGGSVGLAPVAASGACVLSGRVVNLGRAVFLLSILVVSAAACSDAPDDRWPVWSYLSPAIVQPRCATASCHSKGSAESGLDLSSVASGYASMTTLSLPLRDKPDQYPRRLVVPYDPDQSRLIWMMRADGARSMPPDRPLADADIRLFEHWILNGAQND
jgi:hypothetical protein